jgi:DNA-binding transcriptional regulator YiaG
MSHSNDLCYNLREMDAEQIRSIRKRMGMTQEEFAERLGTYQEVISRWERGRARAGQFAVRAIVELARSDQHTSD